MAEKNDIDSLFWHFFRTKQYDKMQQISDALRQSKTDDQARYVVRKALAGVDNEGTSKVFPEDSIAVNHFIQNWPSRGEELTVPSTAAVLASLDYKDSKGKDGQVTKTAQEKFIDDYLSKRNYVTNQLERKVPGFGSKTADILKQAFVESVKDEAEREEQKQREEALNPSMDDDMVGWLTSRAMDLLGSRQKSAYMRGEEPSVGDYLSDYGGNALMLVPGAGYVKALQKVPGVAKALTGLSGKWPKFTKIAEGMVGNSVAPAATEGLQFVGDAIDSDRTAKYNTSAALMGALTNYGVNDILLRKAGQLNRLLLDNEAGRTATTEARNALKGASDGNIKAKDVLQAYVVNKLGDGRAAEYAATRFGIDPKTLKAVRQNITDIDDERYPEQPLPTEGLTEQDSMYIQKIIDNPESVFDDTDTDFKMWFATRGNELLRGTKYHVPTLEVKF